MGNSESSIQQRNENTDLMIFIKTDRQSYYPGNVVYGKVYLRFQKAMNFQSLDIHIDGIQKQSFLRHTTVREKNDEGDETTRTETHLAKEKKSILEFQGQLPVF